MLTSYTPLAALTTAGIDVSGCKLSMARISSDFSTIAKVQCGGGIQRDFPGVWCELRLVTRSSASASMGEAFGWCTCFGQFDEGHLADP